MKKFLLLSATLLMSLVANADVQINETNFPDANFRNYLLAQSWGADGELTDSEISGITSLNVSYNTISSLKGIEFFTALEYLECQNNQLTSLDVSKNTALQLLQCEFNQLTSLDVSKNTELIWLTCFYNQLTSLDVSNCTALRELMCDYNQLTSLDVSNCIALKTLLCDYNQLTSLDVSNCTALRDLECYQNQINGAGMDALINSLPQKESALYIYYPSNTEGNVCTKQHVGIAKQKGWRVYYYYNRGWMNYAGSDPSGIQSITLDMETNTPIYDVNGRRLESPKKGINIIGGKKVVVK